MDEFLSGPTAAVAIEVTPVDDVPVANPDGAIPSLITKKQPIDFAAGDDAYGYSVGVSGDTMVVGEFGDDEGSNANQGSATVYRRSGASWDYQAKIVATDGATDDQFGVSAAISGDTIVVGAPLDDADSSADQGSAYVYVRTGTSWTLQSKILASDGAAGDRFGNSVAISGNTIVVGASYADEGSSYDRGAAYMFEALWHHVDRAGQAHRGGRAGVGLLRRVGGGLARPGRHRRAIRRPRWEP